MESEPESIRAMLKEAQEVGARAVIFNGGTGIGRRDSTVETLQGLFEKTGNIWRAQGRRARLELKHFARHVMTRTILEADEVEGWRGVIEDSEVVKSHEDAVEEEQRSDEESEEPEDEYEDEYDEGEPEDEYDEGEPEDEYDEGEEPEDEYEEEPEEEDGEEEDEPEEQPRRRRRAS